jgi:hypothetical protein
MPLLLQRRGDLLHDGVVGEGGGVADVAALGDVLAGGGA